MCFNPKQWETKSYTKKCQCTEEDWECDAGYTRGREGCFMENQAGQDSDSDSAEEVIPSPCEEFYMVKSGYRKIAGNMCTEGIDHTSEIFECPSKNSLVSGYIWLVLFLLVILFSSIFYFWSQIQGKLSSLWGSLKKEKGQVRQKVILRYKNRK